MPKMLQLTKKRLPLLLLVLSTCAFSQQKPWSTAAPASATTSPAAASGTSPLPPPIPNPAINPLPNTPANRLNTPPNAAPITNFKAPTNPTLPPTSNPTLPPSATPNTPSLLGGILDQATKALDPNLEVEDVQSVYVGKINGKRIYNTEIGALLIKPPKTKKYEINLVKPVPPAQSASDSTATTTQTLFPTQKPPKDNPNAVGGVTIKR